MNKGLFQNFLVQQMMMGAAGGGGGGGGSGASCWSNINSLRSPPAPPEQAFPLFPLPNSSSSSPSSSSSSPSSVYGHHHHYPQGMLPAAVTPPNLHDAAGQDHHLPESWSQFLLGGYNLGEAENKYGMTTGRKMENSLEDHLVLIPSSASAAAADHIKQEFPNCHAAGFNNNNLHAHGSSNNTSSNTAEEISKAQWNQILPASSPCSSRSNCISASTFSPRNMLDFTNMNTNSQPDPRILHHQSSDNNNNSSECNSSTTATGVALKKARVQGSSSSAHSTFKVRKEKLGDRITALHQIVSPFGKTDTASVLLEAIGYIRFLQSQIEALSSPYLSNGSAGNMKQHHQQQPAVTPSNETGNGKKRGPPELQESGKDDNDSHSYNEEASKKKKQKDLRSRGLCLVPVSFFLHVGGEHVNGADYWASALHGAF